jgi:hypothetical protein
MNLNHTFAQILLKFDIFSWTEKRINFDPYPTGVQRDVASRNWFRLYRRTGRQRVAAAAHVVHGPDLPVASKEKPPPPSPAPDQL